MKKIIFTCLLLCAFLVKAEQPERGELREAIEPYGFLYGFGLGLNQEIYQGFDRRVIPLPILGYRGEKLRVLGPFIGYDLHQLGDFEVAIQAAPRFQGFDENDSDIFIGMKQRKFSVDAGLALRFERQNWKLNAAYMHDVLGRSHGSEWSTEVARVFRYGPIFIEPSVALSYLDSKHVNYYYGVKANEVLPTRPAYKGDDALNPSLALSVSTPMFFGGFSSMKIQHTWYDSEITNSPLVDDDTNLSLVLFFSKFW
ncbi:MipA/OmpV family protein [Colwellia sp. MEBiC06753]